MTVPKTAKVSKLKGLYYETDEKFTELGLAKGRGWF